MIPWYHLPVVWIDSILSPSSFFKNMEIRRTHVKTILVSVFLGALVAGFVDSITFLLLSVLTPLDYLFALVLFIGNNFALLIIAWVTFAGFINFFALVAGGKSHYERFLVMSGIPFVAFKVAASIIGLFVSVVEPMRDVATLLTLLWMTYVFTVAVETDYEIPGRKAWVCSATTVLLMMLTIYLVSGKLTYAPPSPYL